MDVKDFVLSEMRGKIGYYNHDKTDNIDINQSMSNYGLDSLDIIETIVNTEHEFDVDVEIEKYESDTSFSIDSLIKDVESLLQAKK